MLEEEYKKETDGKTYLLLKKTKETFEEEMIRKAAPVGVLPMVRSELEKRYKYDITGKKSLAVTFERVPMNAEQIEKVLYGILDIIENGKEYLLCENNYVLLPEHIYLQIPEYKVVLCYYPEYEVPFSEQLGKLFEILLNRVDYREEKAIAMVYALYMQLQEPDVTLECIRKRLRDQAELSKNAGGVPQNETRREVAEYRYADKEETVSRQGVPGKKEEPVGRVPLKMSLWERLRKEVGAKIYGREEKDGPNFAKTQVSCVCDTSPEWGARYTKVLSVKKQTYSPALIARGKQEKVFLTKFPFYVGSMPDYMDYVIDRDTVSRFHAKLIMQDEQVYLVDLNSTNGTWVNGVGLNVREQVLLSEGDRILFADAEYIFTEKEPEEKEDFSSGI